MKYGAVIVAVAVAAVLTGGTHIIEFAFLGVFVCGALWLIHRIEGDE